MTVCPAIAVCQAHRFAGQARQILWAANHWPVAVVWHTANHPETQHVCQDLHQARWEQVPAHDILLASPCCPPTTLGA